MTASRDGNPVICPACVMELEACKPCPERKEAATLIAWRPLTDP